MFMFAIAWTRLHCGSVRKYSERLFFINTVQTYIFRQLILLSGNFHGPLEEDQRPEGLKGHAWINRVNKICCFLRSW